MGIKNKLYYIFKRGLKLCLRLLVRLLVRLLGKCLPVSTRAKLVEELKPIIEVKTDRGKLLFSCPGYLPLWRAQTLLTKEPETIEWIDNFDDNSVFWDIGANIGVYSLYAALNKTIQVYAFEPAAINYSVLNENIKINCLDDRIHALSIAFNDQTKIDHFYMSDTKVGSALHSFGDLRDQFGKPFQISLKQAMIGFKIDDFVSKFNFEPPNYIKIDVDGIEHKILSGAAKTLEDSRVKSILVELDGARSDQYNETVDFIVSRGFKLTKRVLYSMSAGVKCELYNNIFFRID